MPLHILHVHLKSISSQFTLRSMFPFSLFVLLAIFIAYISKRASTSILKHGVSRDSCFYMLCALFLCYCIYWLDASCFGQPGTMPESLCNVFSSSLKSISLSLCDLLKYQLIQNPHSIHFLYDILPVLLAIYHNCHNARCWARSDFCHSFRDD